MDASERVPVWRWPARADPAAVRRVRRVVAVECRERELTEEVTDSVTLAMDELATNAVRYGPFELRVYERPLAFAVADACPEAGVVRAHLAGEVVADDEDECGRGLAVVAALFPAYAIVSTTLASGEAGKEIRLTVEGETREGVGAPAPTAEDDGRVLGGRA